MDKNNNSTNNYQSRFVLKDSKDIKTTQVNLESFVYGNDKVDTIVVESKQPKKQSKKFLFKIIYFLVMLGLLLCALNLSSNIDFSEWMTRNVGKYWVLISGSITSFIPFSLFEILAIIFGIYIVYIFINNIRRLFKKKFKVALKSFTNCMIICLTIASLYATCTSYAYNRKPVDIPLYNNSVDSNEVVEITKYYINKLNNLSGSLNRQDDGQIDLYSYYSFEELSTQMKEEFKRLDSDYFYSFTPTSKKLLTKWIFTQMNTTGITFTLTGEPNVNTLMPLVDIPFTMAHEIAHTKGVMREDDANLVAYYICITSSSPIIQYCGLFWAYQRLMSAVYYTSGNTVYSEVNSLVDKNIKAEQTLYWEFWDQYKLLDKLQDWINDLYLKINGVEEGTGSYNDQEDVTDTGETREDGSIIYEVEYSPVQKMMFQLYFDSI